MPPVQVVIGIVVERGRVLITRRHDDGRHLAGFWEFPGGKVEPGESLEDALRRELAEELDIKVSVRSTLQASTHDYPSATVVLHPFICDLSAGDPKPLASQEFRWVTLTELPDYQFPPANAAWLKSLADHLPQATT
ncbi:8-oxo-dGTP diphosphatase MutT [Humisphaera borealis]|uniref:8-oxo-dGTP diphosphatase n=1 Tax=Humisphaera borealis TaxID=2807512 RepID=A0A7M2WXX6_9BACT|nr:8-oxo-dGTP diphosphatase MutT [Humisphaera borealis]QOV90204.1 8-oxo-dGTP diphosphatase MutT [Humisphaera borealis]